MPSKFRCSTSASLQYQLGIGRYAEPQPNSTLHLGLPCGHGKAENMAPEVVTSPRVMAVKTNGCVITRGLQGPKSSLFTVHSATEASVRFLCDPSRNSNGIRTFGVKATRKLKIQKNLPREPNFSTISYSRADIAKVLILAQQGGEFFNSPPWLLHDQGGIFFNSPP